MELQFYKLAAGKSDLILVNLMDEVAPADNLLSRITRALCRRRTGVGANGVVFLLPGSRHQISLRYFLAGGFESLLFAEPVLYASRYLFDMGIIGKKGFVIETKTGEVPIRLIDSSNFAISLGVPKDAKGNGITDGSESAIESLALIYNSEYRGKVPLTLIDLGLSGAVFFREESLKNNREYALRLIESLDIRDADEWIPIGVLPYRGDEIAVRSWGRFGSGHPVTTAAIGAVASMIHGFSERSSLVYVRGSRFFVQWREGDSVVDVSGSAEYIFAGNYFFDEEDDDNQQVED